MMCRRPAAAAEAAAVAGAGAGAETGGGGGVLDKGGGCLLVCLCVGLSALGDYYVKWGEAASSPDAKIRRPDFSSAPSGRSLGGSGIGHKPRGQVSSVQQRGFCGYQDLHRPLLGTSLLDGQGTPAERRGWLQGGACPGRAGKEGSALAGPLDPPKPPDPH